MGNYWIYYGLAVSGLVAWWANKERNKGLKTSGSFRDSWSR